MPLEGHGRSFGHLPGHDFEDAGAGLRTGWIAAPEAVLARINLVKQGADLCGSAFDQLVVQHYLPMLRGSARCRSSCALYKERRDAMLAALDEFFPPEAT